MKESSDNIITGTLARIETTVNHLANGFTEFKVSHTKDIDLLHVLREKLETRVKQLEDEAMRRAGGIMSARTVMEGAVVLASVAYYILEIKR